MGLLYLSAPVEFEPVSQLSSVFFDAERGQVFSVRGGGVTGVVVKSLEENILTVRLQSTTTDPIISIKLSPSLATLSIQRSRQTVTFLPLTPAGPDDQAEYSQWRRDVEAGITDQETILDTAIESLWEELFHQPLDIQALVEDDNYDELR